MFSLSAYLIKDQNILFLKIGGKIGDIKKNLDHPESPGIVSFYIFHLFLFTFRLNLK